MIRRIGFLLLVLWVSHPAAAAENAAFDSAASDANLPRPDLLRKVTKAEFRRSLVGGVIRGVNPEVRLNHGSTETFLPDGRYRVTWGPSEGWGTYALRSGVLCARTDAEPQRSVCRVILTDGDGRFFARPPSSPDDQTGEGAIAELRIDHPHHPPLERLRPVTAVDFEKRLTDVYLRPDSAEVTFLSAPEIDTYFRGGRLVRRFGPFRHPGSYRFRHGVVCATDDARPAESGCQVLLTDGHGRYFSRTAASADDTTGRGTLWLLTLLGPADDAPRP